MATAAALNTNNNSTNKEAALAFPFANKQQELELARQRLERIRNRPTFAAAKEFFGGSNVDWKSLPRRLERLCQAIQDWVSYNNFNE